MHSGAVQKGGGYGDRKGGIQEIKSSDGMGGEGRERESQDRAQGQHEDTAVLCVGQRDSRSHLCANQPFSWLMRCCLAVHMENLSLWLFGCKLQRLVVVGGGGG